MPGHGTDATFRTDGIVRATMKALLVRSHRMMMIASEASPDKSLSFNSQELSNLIYSVASFSSHELEENSLENPLILPEGWMDQWINVASHPRIKSRLSPQSMANIAWSFTQLSKG